MGTPGQTIFPEYHFKSHFLKLGSSRMHYLDVGEGEPVLMVHGNPSWSFMYRRLARALSSAHRVIVPDHIGCGLSTKPSDDEYTYTMASRVSDLERLLDSLGVEENLTLVVHDWGGLIGLCMAVRRPERIRRIIVFNTAAFHLPAGKSLHWTLRYCRRSALAGLMIRGVNAFAVIASRVGCRQNPMTREIRKAYLAPYGNWADRIAVLRFVQDIPASPEDPAWGPIAETDRGLERLARVPMLICWGDRDFVFDGDFRDEWVRRFPDAELHRFSNAGHYVLEDVYEEILPLVEAFLERHPV
ncbi:MAG: alpha/beta fold hydrolase [Acidobacteriota bacterium]|nr:MAG: alpha/beta fold hydrolase [Acidobacteriota bacterium]